MCSAQSGKSQSRYYPGKRAILGLFALLGLFYLIGYGVLYIWQEDIDVEAKLRVYLGIGAAPEPPLINHDKKAASRVRPAKKERKRRKLRPAPIMDGLPVIDEFTESIKQGRPVPPKDEASVLVDMPDAPPPDGITMKKSLEPIACWDARGFEHPAHKCDSLFALNQVIKSKLDLFIACREEIDAADRAGALSFHAEADFVRDTLSVWLNKSIGVRSKAQILDCVSDALSTLSIENIPHRYSRYRLTGKVEFKGLKTAKVVPGTPPVTEKAMADLEKALKDADEVNVVRERVRVRKSPVDGEIIGFISKPAKVRLIEKSDEWCLVKTKRGNVGWMVCWGLSVGQENKPPAQGEAVESTDEKSPTAPPPTPLTEM